MSNKKYQTFVKSILVEMVYSKWLLVPLFVQPTLFGIIRNNDVSETRDILLEFSKLIKLILKQRKLSGNSIHSWTSLFTEFIEERFAEGQQFAETILSFKAPDLTQVENSTNDDKVGKNQLNFIA